MRPHHINAPVFMCALLLAGCVRDPVGPELLVPQPSTKGVYVLNEGNFGRGNSTLSYYDDASRTVYQDVFSAVNNRPLGDVGNSIVIRNGRIYVVVNNSNKIEILDEITNASVGTIVIGGGRSPRQMAFVNDSLALVTCLYDGSVLEVNVRTMAVVHRTQVGPNPEGIVVAEGKAYVANSGLGYGNTMSIVDIALLTVTRTLTIGDNPIDVTVTPAGIIYVVCAGFYGDAVTSAGETPASVMVIDPVADDTVKRITLGGHAYHIAVTPEGIAYVPTTGGLVAIDTRQHVSLGTFVAGSFYGVAVDPETDDVYVSDSKNYVQPGTVYVYTSSGRLRTHFTVGIDPGTFAFKQ